MATSIPFDPSLVLGQIVEEEKFKDLQEIAEAQKPLDLALNRLNNVTETAYRLKNIEHEMESIGVPWVALWKLDAEIEKMEAAVVEAALEYGKTATSVYQNVEDLMNKQAQKSISYSIESPVDFGRTEVTNFPLSFDAIEMDVQYYSAEDNDQGSSASSKSTQSMNGLKLSLGSLGTMAGDGASSMHSTVLEQRQNSNVQGTVVISAKATHKMADLLSPLVIDPIKAVTAWNYTYPKDLIEFTPDKIMAAALGDYSKKPSEKPTIDIITGCTKASSFVGFVHILKSESETSGQSASSLATAAKHSIEKSMWYKSSVSGGFGGNQGSNTSSNLNSTSFIQNHANLVCLGLIPSIVMNEMTSSVKKMKPDPKAVMEQQEAISKASSGSVNSSMEQTSSEGTKGMQFQRLNSEYMKNAVRNLGENDTKQNKVIDTNSMMTAFDDFMNKAREGKGGIPTNFYITSLTKNDIAKQYIKKFYPSGFVGTMTKEEMVKGTIGISSDDNKEG